MNQRQTHRVQTHRRIVDRQRLLLVRLSSIRVSRIADNWETEMAQVQPNLIRSTRLGKAMNERSAIVIFSDHLKRSLGRQPRVARIDCSRPSSLGFFADLLVTTKLVLGRDVNR